MKAIVASEPGGPERMELLDVEAPVPGPGEVLVQTAVVGVNYLDLQQRSGRFPAQFPFTPGTEAAGTVLAVGEGAQGIAFGDRVTTAWSRATYAEQFLAPAEQLALVPDGIDFETAAALPMQGCTAHFLANSCSDPRRDDTVLIHAGSGGVGLMLTQLLAARGVRVLVTVSSEAKRRLSLEAGAEAVLGYDGFADRVRELTDGEGASVVYDGVGKDTFDESLRSLGVRGRLVLFGASSGQVAPFDLQRLNSGGSLSVTRPTLPHFMRTPEERAWRFRELFAAVRSGELLPRIGGRFALADAADAHRALEGRGTIGKLLLAP